MSAAEDSPAFRRVAVSDIACCLATKSHTTATVYKVVNYHSASASIKLSNAAESKPFQDVRQALQTNNPSAWCPNAADRPLSSAPPPCVRRPALELQNPLHHIFPWRQATASIDAFALVHTFQSLTVRSFAASMSRELLGRAHHLTFLILSLMSKLSSTSNCASREGSRSATECVH